MKKLGKLKLNSFKAMSNQEMKNIVGGYSEGNSSCRGDMTLFTCKVTQWGYTSIGYGCGYNSSLAEMYVGFAVIDQAVGSYLGLTPDEYSELYRYARDNTRVECN